MDRRDQTGRSSRRAGHTIGRVLTTLQIGRAYVTDSPLDNATEGMLLADRERFYLIIERGQAGAAARPNVRVYNYSLRTLRVNGPMFCFDRNTGRRLWFIENLLDNQTIIMDQFQDLPVIVAASPVLEANARFPVYRIVVIQKEEGLLLFNNGVNNSGYVFQSLSVDPRTGTVDFHRYDLRIRIQPDDVKRP